LTPEQKKAKDDFINKIKAFTPEEKALFEDDEYWEQSAADALEKVNRAGTVGGIRMIPFISVTGSRNICLQFRTFLERQLGEPMPPTIISYGNSYAFMVSDSRAVRAIKLLYGGCTLALDRKVRRAYEILDKYEQKELRDGQIEFPHTF
jgi:hypothetical protein